MLVNERLVFKCCVGKGLGACSGLADEELRRPHVGLHIVKSSLHHSDAEACNRVKMKKKIKENEKRERRENKIIINKEKDEMRVASER